MRRLTRYRFTLLLCGLAAAPSPLAAQQGRARVQTADAPQPNPEAQEARPEAEPLRVEAISPELEAVLQEWYAKTKGIQKLQGSHFRWKYDATFAVAKIAKGRFFYEAADKGRIDIEPVPQKDPNAKIKNGGNEYALKPDQPERWICDGKQILKIDDVAKTYEVLPIPPEHQGANIMDGPLPFLFGMPPEKAKQRYSMKLVERSATEILLEVRPKLRGDAANWQRADVKLDAKTFLPTAVQLIDPAATGMTVFKFENTQINPNKILEIFKANPFKPVLLTYTQVQNGAAQPLNVDGKPLQGVPSVVGLAHENAKQVLGARGYQNLEIRRGPVTNEPQLRWCVAEQSPPPNAAAGPDQKVVLTLYITEEDLKKETNKRN